MKMRVEQDCIGTKEIPAEVYYGIQTERARENFMVSGRTEEDYPEFVAAIAKIKKAAALANGDCGALTKEVSEAICRAADDVIEGRLIGQYPIDIIQGGGGTSANMNLNEVIANRANEMLTGEKGYTAVHPNTHVNMGQSTNDVIPSAMKIACYDYFEKLIASVKNMETVLVAKMQEYKNVVKIGRTCIQDALPVTFGQEFSGYYEIMKRRREKLEELQIKCRKVPLGATAVGTKMSVHEGYMDYLYPELSKVLGREMVQDPNLFDGLQNADAYVDFSAGLKALACAVSKLATDLRIYSSGPRAGFQEITLPSVQPGSSIMPGKINPVMPELMNQICYQVCGNDVVITMACEGGELDLNVWEPVIIKNIEESAKLLTNGIRLFTDRCLKDLKVNQDICREYSEKSLALSTVIATLIDYPAGVRVAKLAEAENISIKEACLKTGVLTETEAEYLLNPMLLTDGEAFARTIRKYKEEHHVD